ncbi:LysE family translocator [Spirosoma gilvum]
MLLLFCIVCLISFLGSIHPGTVNLAVMQTTLSHNKQAGIWLALGGSLPEIAYSSLAAGGLMLIPANSHWMDLLTVAPIPVLLGAGLVAFRQKPVELNEVVDPKPALPFWKGFLLGSTNPQLLPFWSAVWLYLSRVPIGAHTLIPVNQPASPWVFALGTATGAFGLLILVVWLTDRLRQRIVQYLNGRWVNRLTGILFIGMALWQSIQVLA